MTPDERLHFETFGFLFYRQLFTSDETEKITEAAEEVWTEALGRPPAGDEKMNVWPFVERHETLLRIIDDDRIHGPLTDLLGEDMIWSLSEGNRGFDPERPAHHWHAGPGRETGTELHAHQDHALPGSHDERSGGHARDSRLASPSAARSAATVSEESRRGCAPRSSVWTGRTCPVTLSKASRVTCSSSIRPCSTASTGRPDAAVISL